MSARTDRRKLDKLRDSLTSARALASRRRTASPHARTLRDRRADAQLRSRGYVVVDLLDAEAVRELRSTARALHPAPPAGWSADFYSTNSDVKRMANARIECSMAEPLRQVFADHRSVLHSFVLNAPGPNGGLELHQHSSVVDEDRFRSVVVWCALTDATEENGTLHVVPRSHLLQVGPRPERSASWADAHRSVLLRDHLDSVPLASGQAIIFDNQLLHCSFSNSTDAARISAVAVVVPNAAQLLYFDRPETDQRMIRVYELDAEFFITRPAGNLQWADPEGLRLVDEREWSPTEVDEHQLVTQLPAGNCSHPASASTSPD